MIPVSLIFAQGRVYSVQQFTVSEGLPGNSVNSIFQDSKGFVWIGTQDGLTRYDGNKFKVFRHCQTDSTSLSGNNILSITEDILGNVWIGTRKGGVSVYVRKTGSFKTYLHLPGVDRSLPENDVMGFCVSDNGDVWVKTDNFLCRYDRLTDSFINYGHYSNLFNCITSLGLPVLYESDSTLLLGTKDGLNRFFINKGVFERLCVKSISSKDCNDLISGLTCIGDNLFLAATNSGLQLIDVLSEEKNIVSARYFPGSKFAVNTVYSDSKNNVWIGSKKGLELFNQTMMVYEPVSIKSSRQRYVVPYEVTSVVEDASGLIWVGTRYDGVFKLSATPRKFSSIDENDADNWPLGSFNIKSVCSIDKENLLVGTLTNGAYLINRENRKVHNYIINKERFRNGDDAVYSIYRDDEGSFWLGTNSGVYLLSADKKSLKEFNYGGDDMFSNLLRNNQIISIAKDRSGGIWFGTHWGLYRYNKGKFNGFFSSEVNNLPSDEINVILPDEGNRLWIGTGEGLCFFDLKEEKVKQVELQKQHRELQQQILSLALSPDGKLWIGTMSGLLVMYKDSADYKVQAVEGLNNEMVNGVLVEGSYKVWVSTGKGIYCLNMDRSIQKFDAFDGIPGHVFNQGSVSASSSGELYFGSVSGLCWLNPDSVRYNLHRPRIAITGISVYQRGNSIDVYKEGMSELKIKYKPGMMLEARFAALEFTHPSKNLFRVFLEGYDKEWRPVTKNNIVTFSNLMPGKYTLKVIASNNDMVWNNKPLELLLIIEPPLWMTGYAYVFYLLVFVFVVQLVINYRIRNYKKANRFLTEKTFDKKKIEAQKEILSRINQNLTDSINYATRIQTAMIPTEKRLRDILPKSFVYFRPKDMVSGDFYYVYNDGNKTYIAVVDCTGHGVPGAFMSIIGMDLLKSIIEGNNETNPAKVLSVMSRELEHTLNPEEITSDEEVSSLRDGMDIGLCVINHDNEIIEFAGAVNEVYIVRDNEIITYKGSRYPLGRYIDNAVPSFETVKIPIQKDDMFYLFSDGYADQFGGSEMKKFKYRRFRHLLLNIHQLSSDDQKAVLHQKLEEWKGDLEQVDDILVLGFNPYR